MSETIELLPETFKRKGLTWTIEESYELLKEKSKKHRLILARLQSPIRMVRYMVAYTYLREGKEFVYGDSAWGTYGWAYTSEFEAHRTYQRILLDEDLEE